MTPVTLKRINQLKAKRAEREGAERNAAEELARRINKLTLNMTLETGTTGKAFGSISTRDIEEALKKELPNAEIDRHAIQLEKPIKETGLAGSSRQALYGCDRDLENPGQIRHRAGPCRRDGRGSRRRRQKACGVEIREEESLGRKHATCHFSGVGH